MTNDLKEEFFLILGLTAFVIAMFAMMGCTETTKPWFKDSLPPEGELVLCGNDTGVMRYCKWQGGTWTSQGEPIEGITKWRQVGSK